MMAHFRADSRFLSTVHQAVAKSDPSARNMERSIAIATSDGSRPDPSVWTFVGMNLKMSQKHRIAVAAKHQAIASLNARINGCTHHSRLPNAFLQMRNERPTFAGRPSQLQARRVGQSGAVGEVVSDFCCASSWMAWQQPGRSRRSTTSGCLPQMMWSKGSR